MKHARILGLCATFALTAALSSCSGDKNEKAGESKADSSASSKPSDQESVDPANVTPIRLKALPKVKGRQGAADDLTLGTCKTDAGQQAIAGKIKSSAKESVDYLVTVSWTNDTNDVMGRGFMVLPGVAPGSTAKFKIRAKVGEGATTCVTGAEYGRIS
jgi:hypothetical protein